MGTAHAQHEHRPLLQGHLQLQLGCPACRQRQGWPKKGMGLGFLFEWRCAGGLGPLSFLLLPARCLPSARRAAQWRPSAAAEPSQPAQTTPHPPRVRGTPGLAQGKELALTAAGGEVLPLQMCCRTTQPNPSSKQRVGKAGWAAGWAAASAQSCFGAVSEAGRGEGAYREAGIAGLDPELCQHPDAIGEFQGLVEHVLALHIPLGNGEDVAALELAANGICVGGESCCGCHSGQGTGLRISSLWTCSCPTSSFSPSPHPAMQHIQNPPSPRSEEKGSIQPGSQVLPGEGRQQPRARFTSGAAPLRSIKVSSLLPAGLKGLGCSCPAFACPTWHQTSQRRSRGSEEAPGSLAPAPAHGCLLCLRAWGHCPARGLARAGCCEAGQRQGCVLQFSFSARG